MGGHLDVVLLELGAEQLRGTRRGAPAMGRSLGSKESIAVRKLRLPGLSTRGAFHFALVVQVLDILNTQKSQLRTCNTHRCLSKQIDYLVILP